MKLLFTHLLFIVVGLSCSAQSTSSGELKCLCSEIGLDSLWAGSNKVSCYLVPVSKNRAKPSKEKILLAVAVAASLNKTNESPLLYLHGGPGIATLENLLRYLKSKTWNLIRQKRSIVFLDYRGTGFSQPNLHPELQDSLAAFLKTGRTEKEIRAYKDSLFTAGRRQLLSEGTELSAFSSVQFANDAEEVRKALHIVDWNVYAVSFGTTVALNMLRNHDKHIRSVILDSPFPPNAPWVDFVHPFNECFKVLEKNIGGDPIASSSFGSLRNDFAKAVQRLNRNPAVIKDSNNREGLKYTGDDFAWSVWNALLKPRAISFVPLAIREVAGGNDSILRKWIAAFSTPNAHGKFSATQSWAVLCHEGRPRTLEESQSYLMKKFPEFASFNSGFDEAICNAWRPDVVDKKIFEPVRSNVPVLILSGEYDPVCPPVFAAISAHTLTRSTSVVVPSASHAAIHADECLQNIANSFLLSPLAKADISCVRQRLKINFIVDNLSKALEDFRN